jgi:hypothetical protein
LKELSEKFLSELKKEFFIELSQLSDCKGEKSPEYGRLCTMLIWKDVIIDDELRIVSQFYSHCWCIGIGLIQADSFRINHKDKISELEKEELYDFT